MFMKWRVAVNENRQLGILLLEDIPFDKLLIKLERAFGVSLPCEDDKGRYVAKAELDDYNIKVIDRVDRLGDVLCDDNHVIDVKIKSNDFFNPDFERKIKKILRDGDVKWKDGIWTKLHRDEDYRVVYPDS